MADIEVPFTVQSAPDHAQQMLFDIVGLTTILTDLNAGGIARSMVEAFAIRLEALDSKMFFGIERAIPASLFTAFNFGLAVAVKASGVVTFNRAAFTEALISIPKGTVVVAPATGTLPQVSFATLTDASMPTGSNYIDVPVAATIPGESSNVSAGRITDIQTSISLVGSVINYAAIKNGADQETEEERRVRFRKYVMNLARSPLAGIEVGAATAQILDQDGFVVERVQKAIAIQPDGTVGRVNLYVDNGGGSASPELVALAQKIVDGYKQIDGTRVIGYKAAGAVVTVAAIVSVPVNVTAKIEVDDGFVFDHVKLEVQSAIEDFFLGLDAGQEMVFVDLLTAIAIVTGVRDVVVTAPTTNLNADASERLLAGTILITEF